MITITCRILWMPEASVAVTAPTEPPGAARAPTPAPTSPPDAADAAVVRRVDKRNAATTADATPRRDMDSVLPTAIRSRRRLDPGSTRSAPRSVNAG